MNNLGVFFFYFPSGNIHGHVTSSEHFFLISLNGIVCSDAMLWISQILLLIGLIIADDLTNEVP